MRIAVAGQLGSPLAPAARGRLRRRTRQRSAVVWAAGDAATPGPRADRVAALVRRGEARPLPLPRRRLRDRHAQGVPALVPPALRPPRPHHVAHHRQPRVGQPLQGLLPLLVRPARASSLPPWSRPRSPAGRSSTSTRRHRTGPARPRSAGSSTPSRARATAASRSGTGRATAQGAYAGAPDLNPLWNRLVGHARIVLSGHDHNLQRHSPQGGPHAVRGGRRRPRPLRAARQPRGTMAWGRDDITARSAWS